MSRRRLLLPLLFTVLLSLGSVLAAVFSDTSPTLPARKKLAAQAGSTLFAADGGRFNSTSNSQRTKAAVASSDGR